MRGSTAAFTGASGGVEAQHRPLALRDDLLVVRVDHEREHRAVDAERRLDDVWCVALLAVDPLELRSGCLRVRCEVEVAAVGDALELRPADREQVLDVARRGRVVRELLRLVRAHSQVALPQAVAKVPRDAGVDPVAEPLLRLGRRDEVLHLHLLELECAEDEVPRRDLVPERLADLRDAERRLPPGDLRDVLEVDEDALCGLRAQVRVEARLLERPDPRLEHQVELARLGEVALLGLARMLARSLSALGLVELISAVAALAEAAVDERVREAGDVPRRLPDGGMQDDRRVERDDVVSLAHHRLQPAGLDVVLEQDAVVAVVVRGAEAAVDLARGKDETRACARARRSCPW